MTVFRKLFATKKSEESVPCEGCPFELLYEDAVSKLGTSWQNINMETQAPITGLYVVECEGDNHKLYEIHEYLAGTLIWDNFQGEMAHSDGWASVKPSRYVVLPIP